MQYRKFGKTGWDVSEIGFGGWQIGGQWGEVDDSASVSTLHYAFEKGINFVDTAQMYGVGHSETVIGKALKQWSGNKIYVATKTAPIEWPSHLDDHPTMRARYPKWYLRDQVEGSLKRLDVERIDLLQLHCWIPNGVYELDWLETLNELRLEGKIDQIGVSVRDNRPEEGVGIAKLGLVASEQVVFNMFDQRPADALFEAGLETGTAFISRVPFDSGSLIGNWNENTYDSWKPGSVPHNLFKGERFAEALKHVKALKEICTPYYETLAEAALRYTLHHPAGSVVIPGMKNQKEVDLNVVHSDGKPFPEELLAAMKPHVWARNFYF